MSLATVGAVVIGRNEGSRLIACLDSLVGQLGQVVYVDSGSTDGSLAAARARGVQTVELDLRQAFTAARARNAGLAELRRVMPGLAYVQFVDGDCEVQSGWLAQAQAFLSAHPEVAVVCGRRRERAPQASIYNLLCDLEWAVPAGAALYCGGDAMFRVDALAATGGYRETLIAGEEPELCVRLRARGWQVQVLAAEMTLHDAAMSRFGQWWLRSVRAGYAYAAGAALHGATPERHFLAQVRRALLWGLALPLILGIAAVAQPLALALWLVYPLQWLRLAWRADGPWRQRCLQAGFFLLGKFAEAQGVLRFARDQWRHRPGALIEYK